MSDLSATLAEARDLFLEAEFELAAEKFEAAKTAAAAAGDTDSAVAADTGLAEVAIQHKNWEDAVQLLEAAAAIAGAKPAGLVRVHYMLGLARMAQGRAEEARGEFEEALEVARTDEQAGGGGGAAGVRGDIEDRLAQLDELESLEEEDILEIAMEFGASAAADEYGPGGEDDDDDEGDEDEDDDEEDEDDDEEGIVGADNDEDDDDDERDEEDDEEEEHEVEAEAAAAIAVSGSLKRKAAPENGAAAPAAGDNGSGVDNGEKRARPSAAAAVANGDSHDGDKKAE